jgi:transposase
LRGYFTLFAEDYVAQIGSTAPTEQLARIQSAIIARDAVAAGTSVDAFRAALTNYQPVALTNAQIAERGQLLYIFTDLVYSSKKFRRFLRRRGIRHTIARKVNEQRGGSFDQAVYRQRNRMERLINRLKQFRRIATQYEKRAANYAAMLTLAFILLWL